MDETAIWLLTIIISIVGFVIWNYYIQIDDGDKSTAFESVKNIFEDISDSAKKDKFNILAILILCIQPLLIIGGFALFIKFLLEKIFN